MEFQYLSFISAIVIFGTFAFLFIHPTRKRNGKLAPEAAGAWPVLGHLHLLTASGLPHKTLASMADKYGPVFTIRLGLQKTIVVSDSNIAKECFTTNDKAFATRPKSLAGKIMGYNHALFGLSFYGPYWREVRKTATLQLLSNHRLHMLAHIRVSEVKAFIQDAYLFWSENKNNTTGQVMIDMKDRLGCLVLNIVVKMIAGKRYSLDEGEEAHRQKVAINRFFVLLGVFVVSDFVPFLRFLDLGGYEKSMKKNAKEMDQILEGWLKEHKINRSINSGIDKNEGRDFMDVMLSTFENNPTDDFASFDRDTIIKSTCGNLLLAGTDTTSVTLTWALALLLNNPDVLKKAQSEVDDHVGIERQVEESDIKNLVYIQAIIKETLRLYPAGPLSVPHESMESCNLGGYEIPKGTRLLVNLWKIHRDPETWSDPLKFEPGRFLTTHKDVDIRGQHFELIPFGSGRRMCPGVSFALQVTEFTLASLIHSFNISPPSDDPIDMTESFGLTIEKTTPLHVLLKPRLSTHNYH
jgi:cytochrome P450